MIFDFYIFGTPDGYKQYPTNSHRSRFKEFAVNRQADKQLNVYRKGQLMYYAYTQKLDEPNSYIGICLVFNGICCLDIHKLFNFFDSYIVFSLFGKILQRTNSGKTTFSTDNFRRQAEELENCISAIQLQIEIQLSMDFVTLDNSFDTKPFAKYVSLNDDSSHITEIIRKYQYVIVTQKALDPKKAKKIRTNKKTLRMLTAVAVAVLVICSFWGVKQFQEREHRVENSKVVLQDGATYTYSGKMHYRLPNGEGKAIYQNDDVYEGGFENGLKNGYGTMTFSDGYVYTGEYLYDKANGQGEMQYPNGKIYRGGWKDNLQHGKGVVIENGIEISGEWENGIKIK